MPTSPTIPVLIQNNSTSNTMYCYVTGYDPMQNNKLMLLASDGKTPYYPPSPPQGTTNQPLPQDCAIAVGKAGATLTITLPYIGGCRIWFVTNKKMVFGRNPGPSLVEPSVTNSSDPNIGLDFAFAELTYNSDQMFANISCVDFVPKIPISATLTTTAGLVDHVSGMGINGLANVCAALRAQAALDKMPWDKLIVNGPDGLPLRVLAPNNAMVGNGGLFAGYFDAYVNAVWQRYAGATGLSVDTQAQYGVVTGTTKSGAFVFDNGKVSIPKPATADIFTCATGAFASADPETLCVVPRLAAAFNRATLLSSATTPDPNGPASFYRDPSGVCNHYARIVHAQLYDGRGYAFPYDDVCANGGPDQCGAVYDGQPKTLTFAVGGNAAYVTPGAAGVIVQ